MKLRRDTLYSVDDEMETIKAGTPLVAKDVDPSRDLGIYLLPDGREIALFQSDVTR